MAKAGLPSESYTELLLKQPFFSITRLRNFPLSLLSDPELSHLNRDVPSVLKDHTPSLTPEPALSCPVSARQAEGQRVSRKVFLPIQVGPKLTDQAGAGNRERQTRAGVTQP